MEVFDHRKLTDEEVEAVAEYVRTLAVIPVKFP